MKTGEQTINTYLTELSARRSTPGGGAVAALTGAQAASLISMVGEFSDKSMAQKDREILLNSAKSVREQFIELADLDAKNFAILMDCYKNKSGIQQGLKDAAQAPLACLKLTTSLVPLIEQLDEFGNQNLVTDTGIAASLLRATIEASEMNVRVNLRSIKDETYTSDAIRVIEQTRQHLASLSRVAETITKSLG